MKKLLVLVMTFVMVMSLAACGGEDTPAPEQSTSNEGETTTPAEEGNEAEEIEFVPKAFGYITMNVPDVFGEVTEQNGNYVSAGPDSSIVVLPAYEVDLLPSEWDEGLAAEALELYYGSTYTNLELAGFEGEINMNGNEAVYYAFYGTNASGQDRLVHVVRLYNADLTAVYAITFMHSADSEFFTPELSLEIINSITLAEEAQNLTAQS